MQRYLLQSAAILFLCTTGTSGLYAQATTDIRDAITTNTQIDEALAEQQRTTYGPAQEADGEIDGEAGVYVLELNEIFYIGATLGGGYAENPVQTIDDLGGSAYANAAISAGVSTQIDQKVNVGMALSLSGIEYAEDFAPSSRTATASVNVGTRLGKSPVSVGLTVFGGKTYDTDFKNGSGFYGGSASINANMPIGPKTILGGSLVGGRRLGAIEENASWNATASIGVTHFLAQDLSIGVSGQVTRTWYDNFYEDVTFIPRNDWDYGGNVNASWSPNEWLSVSASAGYGKRDSTFFLSNYDGFEGNMLLSGRVRF